MREEGREQDAAVVVCVADDDGIHVSALLLQAVHTLLLDSSADSPACCYCRYSPDVMNRYQHDQNTLAPCHHLSLVESEERQT